MIELQNVALRAGDRRLLHHVEARIGTGEFVALLGPNGAGKTTLLRAMAGLHPIDEGSILLDRARLEALAPRERARRIAFVTADEVVLDELGVAELVAIGRFPHHRWWEWQTRPADSRAVGEALAAVRMESFASRIFSTLSAGERQRIWIALGLAQETPILLLDEPTSHLDIRVAHEILALLRDFARAGKTVVCALHDINEAAAYADSIALIAGDSLLPLAQPERLVAGPALERVYGIAMERVRLPSGRLGVFAKVKE